MAYGLTQSITLVAASTQSVSAADSASLSQTGTQTHEGSVNFTTVPTSGNGVNIFSKYAASTGQRGISVVYENVGGTLQFNVRTSVDGNTVLNGTLAKTLSAGTWYYLRFVFNSGVPGNMDIYVDDMTTKVGTIGTLATSINDNTAPYNIGVQSDISSPLNAQVSLWRVWSVAHTTSDQCTVYGGATANMQAEWSLNNVLTDASGNSNTLTNNNSATFTSSVPSVCVPSVNSNFFLFMR